MGRKNINMVDGSYSGKGRVDRGEETSRKGEMASHEFRRSFKVMIVTAESAQTGIIRRMGWKAWCG